jgi:hypothetical protein
MHSAIARWIRLLATVVSETYAIVSDENQTDDDDPFESADGFLIGFLDD